MRAAFPLLDKKKLAFAGAKFRAWWDGEDFDEDAFIAANTDEEEPVAEAAPAAAPAPKIITPPSRERDPRIAALELLWGEGRLCPGDAEQESAAIDTLGISPTGTLAILAPNYTTPLMKLTESHKGAVKVFEWRDDVLRALRDAQGAGELRDRTDVIASDVSGETLPNDTFAGVVSFDDFTFAPDHTVLAERITKSLKRGGRAVIEAYVGDVSPKYAPAFASAFGEQHVRPIEDIRGALVQCGMEVKQEEDITEAHEAQVRARFLALRDAMTSGDWNAPAVSVAKELEWELETWRVRMQFFVDRRLQRRRISVRR